MSFFFTQIEKAHNDIMQNSRDEDNGIYGSCSCRDSYLRFLSAGHFQKTSGPFAPERKDLAIKDPHSTALFLDLCARVETSPTTMALGARAYTAENLMMKTSSSSMVEQVRNILDTIF